MSDPSFHTAQLHDWLARDKAGDPAAREELVRAVAGRLERLARGMLRDFPNLPRPLADTDDVFQGAAVRLVRSLRTMAPPGSAREFLAFAAACVRTELLDLARRYAAGKRGTGRHPALPDDVPTAEPIDLDRWCRFHEAVAELPPEEREVVGLKFYHGWTEAEVADLFKVSERTVRRWWRSACGLLHARLGGDLPGG